MCSGGREMGERGSEGGMYPVPAGPTGSVSGLHSFFSATSSDWESCIEPGEKEMEEGTLGAGGTQVGEEHEQGPS